MYRVIDVLIAIGAERGVPPAQVALNWLLAKPCVDTVVIGARNEEQLQVNLGAAQWRMTPEEVARLDEASTTPEPYPYWHQHKFGVERNPRLPPMRK
jgi:aryl-alcohol dehydrogenase-like predicted oxidoreductase